jgi:hypothetical protein
MQCANLCAIEHSGTCGAITHPQPNTEGPNTQNFSSPIQPHTKDAPDETLYLASAQCPTCGNNELATKGLPIVIKAAPQNAHGVAEQRLRVVVAAVLQRLSSRFRFSKPTRPRQ